MAFQLLVVELLSSCQRRMRLPLILARPGSARVSFLSFVTAPSSRRQTSLLQVIDSRFGQIDAAVGRVGADSREGHRELSWGVQRLEAKLDRLIAAVEGTAAVPGPAASQERGLGSGGGMPERGSGRDLAASKMVSGAGDLSAAQVQKEAVALGGGGSASDAAGLAEPLERDKDDVRNLLAKIAEAVGVSLGPPPSDDEEDRRRLKERFKDALEKDQDRRIREEETTKEKWLEYVFGICKPDGRIGKAGSRCAARRPSGRVRPCLVPCE